MGLDFYLLPIVCVFRLVVLLVLIFVWWWFRILQIWLGWFLAYLIIWVCWYTIVDVVFVLNVVCFLCFDFVVNLRLYNFVCVVAIWWLGWCFSLFIIDLMVRVCCVVLMFVYFIVDCVGYAFLFMVFIEVLVCYLFTLIWLFWLSCGW